MMLNSKINEILGQNDREGERAIAFMQALMAFTIFLLHIISASKNQWETLSAITITISALILSASILRVHGSYAATFSNIKSHVLTVIDGALIYALMLSYNYAYSLPIEVTFKTPTVIFLVLYSAARVMRSDPMAIIVAGITVLVGWFGILTAALLNDAQITTSYTEFIASDKLLIGAVLELAAGYAAVMFVLALHARNARLFVTKTAHVEDLALANKRAEENILIFEELLSSSVDGVVIVDQEGNIERLNPAIEMLFEYEQDELVGKNVVQLMSNMNADLLREEVQNYLKTKKSHLIGHSFASKGMKKDGREFDIELSISEFNASGKTCFAGFIRDASEKAQALANEQRVKRQFENAMNAAMDAIIIIDQEGRIVQFNPAAEETFGFTFEDVSGRKLSDVIIPLRYREAHENGMAHYLKTGEGPVLDNRIEIEALHANGDTLQIELAIREIEGASGKLFLGYARDITERKNSETELINAKNEAELATRAKTSFLAMMSHEIRTPLNGVLGIHGLLNDTKLDEDQRQLLETATESGQSLLKIINDLLDFSKLEAGKFEIEEKPFNLHELVVAVSNLLQSLADEKQLKLTYEIDDGISKFLIGDATRIRQILLNLSWNAIKFTESGYVAIKVQHGKEDQITFAVKDTGIGIDQDKHKDVFVEFSTLDASYSEKFGGTGLGLAISKALVENMRGEIGFESEIGRGSRFWFTLSLEATKPQVSETSSKQVDFNRVTNLAGLKVLVADDNKTNQLVTSRYLKKFGCVVELANNGAEAIEKAEADDFYLILMDISMPEVNGYEATAAIKEHKICTCPIIALTAYASKEDEAQALSSGMDGFLPKPFSKEELADVMLQHIGDAQTLAIKADKIEPENDFVFDISVLNIVLEDMDSEAIKAIFREFGKDVKRYLEIADDGMVSRDVEKLESASHGLHGVSGMFGARELARLAGEVNQTCRGPDHDHLYKDAAKLIKQAKQIIDVSKDIEAQYLQKQAASVE